MGERFNLNELRELMAEGNVLLFPKEDDGGGCIVLGKPYRIDDYTIRFLYAEDSTEPTHFVIKMCDHEKGGF